MVAFGTISPGKAPLLIVPSVLGGLAFAGPITAYAAQLENEAGLSSCLPLRGHPAVPVLGNVLPDSAELPRWMQPIAYVTPLWHTVELTRSAALGIPTTFDPIVHYAVLIVLLLIGAVRGHAVSSRSGFEGMTTTLNRRIAPPRIGRIRARVRPRARNVLVYRRLWLIVFSGFFEPVFYLFSIGIGISTLVGPVVGPNGQLVEYTAFVAPALLAASAMNGAVYESTMNIFWKLKFAKVYDSMLADTAECLGHRHRRDRLVADPWWALRRRLPHRRTGHGAAAIVVGVAGAAGGSAHRRGLRIGRVRHDDVSSRAGRTSTWSTWS